MKSTRTWLVFALGLGMSLAWGSVAFGSRVPPAAVLVQSLRDTSHKKAAQPGDRLLSRPADQALQIAANTPDASRGAARSTGNASANHMVWTHWDPDLYALADDGSSIWIAAGTGVVRWDKASATYRRFGTHDGLPFEDVVAVVVDGAGNRWFGGLRGLSRLAPDGTWTHFDAANSGLDTTGVDGIAVATNGTLWLSHPNGNVSRRNPDGTWRWYPNFGSVRELALDRDNFLWLFDHDSQGKGPIQVLDDHGTATLADDRWRFVCGPHVVTAFEPAPNGNMWVSGYTTTRYGQFPENARRYHQSVAIAFDPGWDFFATDVFAQDDRRTFFAYHSGDEKGVLALDDGGTVTDPSDDVWTTYPFHTDSVDGSVAVDGLGRLWYGDVDGLYRYDASTWVPINEDYAVADLAPATDGTLFAQIQNKGRLGGPLAILILWPDGRQEIPSTERLVEHELERVRSADRRNSLWAVAADAAVWYIAGDSHAELHRRDGAGLTVYPLPSTSFAPAPPEVPYPLHFNPFVPPPLEVDSNGHVWTVFDSGLRRLSPAPGFTLDIRPDRWLLAPGARRSGLRGYAVKKAMPARSGWSWPVCPRA